MNLDKYKVIPLSKILSNDGGEEVFEHIIRDFACPPNEDVEHFLKHTAITNQNMGISRTNLVFLTDEQTPILLGYYALALQVLDLSNDFQLIETNDDSSMLRYMILISTYDAHA